MKVIALGDIHGKNIWKQIVSNQADHYIFIGDYVDSLYVSKEDQLQNLRDILQFKRDNFDKCTLLLGNHDYHYLPYVTEQYSGYQIGMRMAFQELLGQAVKEEAIQLVKMIDGVLYSHAGVTKTWLHNHSIDVDCTEGDINDILFYQPNSLSFDSNCVEGSIYGDEVSQSPIWVRMNSLVKDRIDLPLVVGHTRVSEITSLYNIWMIDSLTDELDNVGTGQYLEVVDGKFNPITY